MLNAKTHSSGKMSRKSTVSSRDILQIKHKFNTNTTALEDGDYKLTDILSSDNYINSSIN